MFCSGSLLCNFLWDSLSRNPHIKTNFDGPRDKYRSRPQDIAAGISPAVTGDRHSKSLKEFRQLNL
jgi:hypothetical protein